MDGFHRSFFGGSGLTILGMWGPERNPEAAGLRRVLDTPDAPRAAWASTQSYGCPVVGLYVSTRPTDGPGGGCPHLMSSRLGLGGGSHSPQSPQARSLEP
jgi:hypothetical protein